jgi:hypothetical protein
VISTVSSENSEVVQKSARSHYYFIQSCQHNKRHREEKLTKVVGLSKSFVQCPKTFFLEYKNWGWEVFLSCNFLSQSDHLLFFRKEPVAHPLYICIDLDTTTSRLVLYYFDNLPKVRH